MNKYEICQAEFSTKEVIHINCVCVKCAEKDLKKICLSIFIGMHYLVYYTLLFHNFLTYTVNIYRYKAIGANATSSVISTTWKCISPYSFVPINIYSVFVLVKSLFTEITTSVAARTPNGFNLRKWRNFIPKKLLPHCV